MLRLKVVLTFAISILLLAAVSFFSYKTTLSDAISEDTELALRKSASTAELERRLAEATLISKARFVGSAPDLYEAIKADYSTKENPDGEEPIAVAEDVAEHEKHLKVHERLTRYRIEFEQFYESSRGKGKRQLDVPLQWQKPTLPDLIFAVDKEGVGLAALGKDLLKWYGDDVSNEQILVSEALTKKEVRTGLIEWSFDNQSKGVYLVAVAPIMINREQDVAGAVVIGSLISDGTAKQAKSILAGTYEQGLEAEEAKQVLASGADVAYFYGDKIIGSTFDNARQKEVSNKIFKELKLLEQEGVEKSGEIEIEDDTYLVRLRMMPSVGQKEDKKAGIIVLKNLSAEQGVLSNPGTNTWLAAVMILLLGSIMMLIFIQLFMKPIEKIESGMQEVVGGNKDYVFEYQGSNKLAQGLAHQLNLMSAYLQGKPMPDDESGGGGWGDVSGDSGKGGANPRVQGVDMADLMGKKKDSSDS